MITTSRNQGRVHAVSASVELGSATVERALAGPVSSLAAWTTLHTVGFARKRLGRLRGHQGPHRRQAAVEALAEDRRRIAADVHDLIMQDLSFALATARTLMDDPALAPQAGVVVAASERALAGAREVVQELMSRDREPVVSAVEAGVRAAARKTPVTFDAVGVQATAQADQPTHDALVHVGREAVTNAIKHAGSDTAVEVVFERDEEWRLTVRDKGRGFDLDGTPGGFGLESMRSRARELGGALRVKSVLGEGSTVELTLP